MYNKANGAYAGMSQLPAGAITTASFRVSWANNYVWLFNLANFTWYSYQVLTAPLPVELISFAGKCDDGSVELTWSTATETNNNYFTIERTTNGSEYKVLGTIEGAGNSTQTISYSFRDEDPSSEESYYRIKQTDYDGAFSCSEVIPVSCEGGNNPVRIYPNPNNGSFSLSGCTSEDEIVIFDPFGNEVYKAGVNNSGAKEITLSGLAPGIYMLQVTSPSRTLRKKLIINQ